MSVSYRGKTFGGGDKDGLHRAQLEKRATDIKHTAQEMYNNFLRSPPPATRRAMQETTKLHLATTRELTATAYTGLVQEMKPHTIMELHWWYHHQRAKKGHF